MEDKHNDIWQAGGFQHHWRAFSVELYDVPPLQDTRSITALNFILTFILVTAGLVEETASLADSLTNSPVQIRLFVL